MAFTFICLRMLLLLLHVAIFAVAKARHEEACTELPSDLSAEEVIRLCKGEETLGDASSEYVFTPNFMSEDEFNDFFKDIVEVTMCFKLDSTSFTSIKFPKLLRWYSCSSGPALTIVNNPKLLSVELNRDVQFFSSTSGYKTMAVLHANPKLERQSIDHIRRSFGMFSTEISDYGECASPPQVSDLAELNCPAYYGNLVFGTNLRGDIPPSTGIVDGCLNISNTMLTDIEFLRDFRFMPHESCQSVIRGNKHLCVSKELEQHLGRQMNLLIGENMDTSCRKVVVGHVLLLTFIGLFFGVVSLFAASLKLFVL